MNEVNLTVNNPCVAIRNYNSSHQNSEYDSENKFKVVGIKIFICKNLKYARLSGLKCSDRICATTEYNYVSIESSSQKKLIKEMDMITLYGKYVFVSFGGEVIFYIITI